MYVNGGETRNACHWSGAAGVAGQRSYIQRQQKTGRQVHSYTVLMKLTVSQLNHSIIRNTSTPHLLAPASID